MTSFAVKVLEVNFLRAFPWQPNHRLLYFANKIQSGSSIQSKVPMKKPITRIDFFIGTA
jgi:hypothetical protein